MRTFKIALGTKVKDKVTGLRGVVVARTEWLFGCLRYTVQPQKLKDGSPIAMETFDEDALVVLGTLKGCTVKGDPGGSRDTPKRGQTVRR